MFTLISKKPKNIKKSSSIKAILIDDEAPSLESLKLKLEMNCPDVEVLAQCSSAKEGIQAINKYQPNLVFLDIEMPWMNGFEMLSCLGDNINFEVVFVTAYDQYAIRAFKVKAQDYLLKPVDKEDLIDCISRIKNSSKHFSKEKLDGLVEEMDKTINSNRILLHAKNAIEVVNQDELLYLQADSNYCHVYTKDEKRIMVTKTLSEIEKMLDMENFVRIHRSYTVNLAFIKKISTEDGAYDVILESGQKLPVSRRKKENLFEMLALGKKD